MNNVNRLALSVLTFLTIMLSTQTFANDQKSAGAIAGEAWMNGSNPISLSFQEKDQVLVVKEYKISRLSMAKLGCLNKAQFDKRKVLACHISYNSLLDLKKERPNDKYYAYIQYANL